MLMIQEEFLEDYGVLEIKFPDSKVMPNAVDTHILLVDICRSILEKKFSFKRIM